MNTGLYETAPKDGKPRLHQSTASLLVGKSPLHGWFKEFGGAPQEYGEATDTGQLCHALLLGGKDIVPVDAPDWRTKIAKEARDKARSEGKLPVLTHKLSQATNLKIFVLGKLKELGMELTGQSEITAIWTTPGGVECQGRLDHFLRSSGTILDFKFCRSAQPEAIGRSMTDYGYDIQAAAYTQAIETIFPELAGRVKMLFVYIETEQPNAITIARPSGDMREIGESRWARACDIWRDCLERFGTKMPWPSYTDQIVEVDPPAWARKADMEEYLVREREEESRPIKGMEFDDPLVG